MLLVATTTLEKSNKMKKIWFLLLITVSLLVLNACSSDSDNPACPEIEAVSMRINGEVKQFQVIGRGIDLDNYNTGHTLTLHLVTGVYSPQQDTYDIILKLPYKKIGTNIVESFNYYRVANGTSLEGDFVLGELESKVTVNRNTCFSATFSGRATIGGSEVVITEGIFMHVYTDPFE